MSRKLWSRVFSSVNGCNEGTYAVDGVDQVPSNWDSPWCIFEPVSVRKDQE
ncbi:MAG: hypothetical protein WCG14_01955 [Chlamydiia bacterium]